MQPLRPVIGLEVHVQLKTKSKMFCPCDNTGERQAPNTTICSICTGQPGSLPMPNRTAIEWAVKTALALGCQIPEQSKFDRKHYFYPDLPKGYQISQYDLPFGIGGQLAFTDDAGKPKTVRLTRLHLEEDAAKNVHSPDGRHTLVDYNRAGTPLMEIVTEPDLNSPADARRFLQELRQIMRYLDVSEADLEQGHLRCDANVSLTEQAAEPIDVTQLHPKTEIKNLNSFRAVERALEYEVKRQSQLWADGHPPAGQSTRGWDDAKGATTEQRTKEEAHDYRYFPEPDIAPITFAADTPDRIDVEAIRARLPELPAARRARFAEEYGVGPNEARVLTDDQAVSAYFEASVSELRGWLEAMPDLGAPLEEFWTANQSTLMKLTTNWLVNKLFKLHTADYGSLREKITPENFAEFIVIIFHRRLNSTIAQQVLQAMYRTGQDPSAIIDAGNLAESAGDAELDGLIAAAIAANPAAVANYRKGKANAVMFLVGQVMQAAKGKADPAAVKAGLERQLESS